MKDRIRQILREDYIREAKSGATDRVVKLLNSLEFKDDVISAGGEIYAVGGIVRDALMGKNSDDLDIVVRGIPYNELFAILDKYGTPTDTSKDNEEEKDFGATKFKSDNPEFNEMLDNNGIVREIDVMLPRKDAKDPNVKGHKGIKSDVNPMYTIEDDLERRDITINAIALGMDGKIIDKNGQGQKDMESHTIRAVSGDAFLEDPLRMLRAVRFAARFDYNLDSKTLNLIKKNVKLLSDKKELPAERFLMEFKKMIGKVDLGKSVKLLVDLGMYEAIFGVQPKITDFSKFDKAKSLGEFGYMLFEEQPSNTIVGLINRNITNNVKVLAYAQALVDYVTKLKGKKLEMVKEINALAEIFNKSPRVLLDSNYIDDAHRAIGEKFMKGELPRGQHDVAFKGEEFQSFVVNAVESKLQIPYSQKQHGRFMGNAKRLVLQAVYGQQIANDANAIRQFLESNIDKWLV
jgi:tRNA nucleotidyltransferase/poly(A) polymerase